MLLWVVFNRKFQVERDVPAAAELFARACNTTNPRSCVAIARLLQFGKFVEKDYKKVRFKKKLALYVICF